jgi:hypothetical protein
VGPSLDGGGVLEREGGASGDNWEIKQFLLGVGVRTAAPGYLKGT